MYNGQPKTFASPYVHGLFRQIFTKSMVRIKHHNLLDPLFRENRLPNSRIGNRFVYAILVRLGNGRLGGFGRNLRSIVFGRGVNGLRQFMRYLVIANWWFLLQGLFYLAVVAGQRLLTILFNNRNLRLRKQIELGTGRFCTFEDRCWRLGGGRNL